MYNHESKAELLWTSFKERMGRTEFNHMIFNLNQLIQPALDLGQLEVPFTKEEIDGVVYALPNNKSLGPVASF